MEWLVLSPAIAVLVAFIVYFVKVRFFGGKRDTDEVIASLETFLDPEHPLKARLKQKAGDRFDALVEEGFDDDDTYKFLLDQIRAEVTEDVKEAV